MVNKDNTMFTVGRSNFAALLSSDEEDGHVEGVVGEGKQQIQKEMKKDEGETLASEAGEENDAEDEWCPVVAGKKKSGPAAPKEGVSSNPGTGKGAANTRFPSSFSKPHHHHNVIGNGQKKPLQTSQLPPLTLAEICDASKSLELYGFPSKFRTGNLRKFVEAGIAPGAGYRLKWQNDSSCWVVFDEAESLEKAVEALGGDEFIHIRRFEEANLVLTEELMHAKEHQPAEPVPATPVEAAH